MSLQGLLIRLPVDGVDGCRALDLDISTRAECLLLHSQPEAEEAGQSAPGVLTDGEGDQHARRGLLAIDVPAESNSVVSDERERETYQFSVAAGTELEELQLAEIRSPFLYLGRVPEMIGPWSGRSEISGTL